MRAKVTIYYDDETQAEEDEKLWSEAEIDIDELLANVEDIEVTFEVTSE